MIYMKKLINNKVYNTDTAELIAKYNNGSYNFDGFIEELYKTKKGSYFLYGNGQALSLYSGCGGGSYWGIETIIPYDWDDVYEWMVKRDLLKEIEEYFPDKIQEA